MYKQNQYNINHCTYTTAYTLFLLCANKDFHTTQLHCLVQEWHNFSPGLRYGVAGERRAGLDCMGCTEGVGLTVEGSGCSMGDWYCLQ